MTEGVIMEDSIGSSEKIRMTSSLVFYRVPLNTFHFIWFELVLECTHEVRGSYREAFDYSAIISVSGQCKSTIVCSMYVLERDAHESILNKIAQLTESSHLTRAHLSSPIVCSKESSEDFAHHFICKQNYDNDSEIPH